MIPFSEAVMAVVEKVGPSVVACWPLKLNGDGIHTVARKAVGSGFIIDSRGYIFTNHHVIHGAQKVSVEFVDGRKVPASVIGWDVPLDIALIKVEMKRLPVVKLGDSDKLKIGQLVIAIGKPFGFPRPTVTVGVVSSLGQKIFSPGSGHAVAETTEGWIQTDAAINSGNSGGPLLDERGFVIGINTASWTLGEGINFAIPINIAKRVVENFVKLEKEKKPWTGIAGLDLTMEAAKQYDLSQRGILVMRVPPKGAADKAGILAGDVIIEIDGVQLETMKEFQQEISRRKVGETVELTLKRRKRTIRLNIVLASTD